MTNETHGLFLGPDGKPRCAWCAGSDDYRAYHDDEWGRPVADDRRLFEKLCLEGFQSGLSWLTILRKREAFRRAFADFDFERVARFPPSKVEKLLLDPGIVRHRGKIESTVRNARRAKELVREKGSLAAHLWSFEPEPRAAPIRWAELRATTTSAASVALSKDLKRRGWSFVGPTTMHAFLQAVGIVNEHVEGCAWHALAERDRKRLVRPR
jgi:DNA-3-methyladenine glycosylase I